MMNARFHASGRYTETIHTNKLIVPAKNIIKIGSSNENPQLIPLRIIISRESTNSINGQTRTNSSKDTTDAPDHLKSETNKCNDEAAIATKYITEQGNHNQ